MTFQPTGSLRKRHTEVFPVIPDKESQLSWIRDLRFVTSHDVPEHLPKKDHLLDPQFSSKTLVAPIKPSYPAAKEGL